MSEVIIFKDKDGLYNKLIPNVNGKWNLNRIARLITPEGNPFIIVNEEDFPLSNEFFQSFEFDFTNPDGLGEPRENIDAEIQQEIDAEVQAKKEAYEEEMRVFREEKEKELQAKLEAEGEV